MSNNHALEQHNTTQRFTVSCEYPVLFTRDTFNTKNTQLINTINNKNESPKVLVVIDEGVHLSTPELCDKISQYFAHFDIALLPKIVVPAGEASKNDVNVIENIYQAVETHAIDRHSYILVIGGGAVVDAIGYAAATAHRGIRLIRMPSTVLGQNDAGVGVKNAINYHKRKNYIGTFATPHAVINDLDLLDTLSDRDKRSGISEAIKVALIKDEAFFNELYQQRNALSMFEDKPMENMIVKGAKWHLHHISTSGDPFELGSARPLDFGHWSAHKLEELSNNELRHGEAVAIGIAMDSIYSHLAGFLNKESTNKIISLLVDIGFNLNHTVLTKLNVSNALDEFKEHLGGNLCITLLSKIGTGFEVNEINEHLMVEAIEQLKSM